MTVTAIKATKMSSEAKYGSIKPEPDAYEARQVPVVLPARAAARPGGLDARCAAAACVIFPELPRSWEP